MNRLSLLAPLARREVTPDFLEGLAQVDVSRFVTPFHREVDIDPVVGIVRKAIDRFADPEDSDAWLAPRTHACLRLYRWEAADPPVWNYLGVVALPEYVRWRWAASAGRPPMDRFMGPQYKQALARLWWGAELTRSGSDYQPTEVFFKQQDFPNTWMRFNAFHHRPAALAAIGLLSSLNGGKFATGRQINRLGKAFNMVLTTVVLDSITGNPPVDMAAVEDWIEQEADETLMFDRLPRGPDDHLVPRESISSIEGLLRSIARAVLTPVAVAAPLAPTATRGGRGEEDAEDDEAAGHNAGNDRP